MSIDSDLENDLNPDERKGKADASPDVSQITTDTTDNIPDSGSTTATESARRVRTLTERAQAAQIRLEEKQRKKAAKPGKVQKVAQKAVGKASSTSKSGRRTNGKARDSSGTKATKATNNEDAIRGRAINFDVEDDGMVASGNSQSCDTSGIDPRFQPYHLLQLSEADIKRECTQFLVFHCYNRLLPEQASDTDQYKLKLFATYNLYMEVWVDEDNANSDEKKNFEMLL